MRVLESQSMNASPYFLIGALLMLPAPILDSQPVAKAYIPAAADNVIDYSCFAKAAFDEDLDWRAEFFGSLANYAETKRKGEFILIYNPNIGHAMYVSTNECSTVGSALSKCLPGYDVIHHQRIRVVRQNGLTQTPDLLPLDEAGLKRFQSIKLSPGDVVIVCPMI